MFFTNLLSNMLFSNFNINVWFENPNVLGLFFSFFFFFAAEVARAGAGVVIGINLDWVERDVVEYGIDDILLNI